MESMSGTRAQSGMSGYRRQDCQDYGTGVHSAPSSASFTAASPAPLAPQPVSAPYPARRATPAQPRGRRAAYRPVSPGKAQHDVLPIARKPDPELVHLAGAIGWIGHQASIGGSGRHRFGIS